ncbi:MAG: tRNA 4-thiouridine(8) synthase ThiI [Planctomycetota bacterium]|nr:MAG: tRNA 4-thiouridine(8) synthase ThiI [Planctomycetota bacterium]
MLIHVRYDEVALKGGRRGWFEERLRENVARQLGVPLGRVRRTRGRLLVDLPADADPRAALAALGRTFGVASAAEVHRVPKELAAAEEIAVRLAEELVAAGRTRFKCEVRRADKSFPEGSYAIAARLGARVLEEIPGARVDVHEPEFVIGVEVRDDAIYLHSGGNPGPRGVPTGTGGRALCLLSGGIDSPVAAWFALKRGLHVDHCYFHAFPYTGERVLEKVLSIARTLSRWTPRRVRVFVPSTTEIQDRIAAAAPEPLRVVLLRRAMYRIADAIRSARGHKALVTGEALGQVASQTPENLLCVEAVVPQTLVLRPLVGLDKVEIMERARAIGSYETSILPYQDCCSLFAPRSPETRARPDRCAAIEEELELGPLEEASLRELAVYGIERGGEPERLDERAPPRLRDAATDEPSE